ncbi:MAG: sulfotransferase family 2 domain-containing protein [Mesorhizobium sp.]
MAGRPNRRQDTEAAGSFRPVVSERFRFVYAPVTKCGSSTLKAVIAGIHDLNRNGAGLMPDGPVPYAGPQSLQRGRELVSYEVFKRDAAEFHTAHSDYLWFTVVRHPYARALSIYNYDLRKYAKWHAKGPYLAGSVSKFLALASGGDRKRAQRNAIRRRISFADFMHGLRSSGTGFDVHFVPQADLIFLDRVRYDHVLRLETLSEELPTLLTRLGVSQDKLDEILPIPRANPSHPSGAVHDERTRALVYEIYEKDFTGLGYVP